MAKLRINPLSQKTVDFPHKEFETLQQIYDRFFETLPVKDERLHEVYTILLDGEIIDKDLWPDIHPGDRDVLIAIKPKADTDSVLRTGIILTLTLVASAYLGPIIGGGYVGTAIAGTLGAYGGTLLANALVPPPSLDIGGFEFAQEEESSQAYNISGQSNKSIPYGVVPKVYGEHRIYPNIAANPYTEIAVSRKTDDEEGGRIVQYLNVVYDLGYGPGYVGDIKIGNTPIEEFANTTYNIVDFNKPSVSGGDWDDMTISYLSTYSGDVNSENISATLNKNEEDLDAEVSEYQAIRNASDNGDGDGQTVVVSFVCPRGLTTFGTNGSREARTIELDISFAEVGTEDWHPFNDISYVSDWSSIGDHTSADNDTSRQIKHAYGGGYGALTTIEGGTRRVWDSDTNTYIFYTTLGYPQGGNTFFSKQPVPINSYLYANNKRVGTIASRSYDAGDDVYTYTMSSGFPYFIPVTEVELGTGLPATVTETLGLSRMYSEPKTTGNFKIKAESTSLVYAQVTFVPKTTNQVKVRVIRKLSYGGYDYQVNDDLTWTTLDTRYDREPITTDTRRLFLEMRIQATDQLNGVVQNLSAVVSSVLPVYDGSSWNLEKTNNPAWVFADILCGEINKRAVDRSRLDTDSLLEWEAFCDEIPTSATGSWNLPRFECNYVQDYATTVYQAISNVTTAANASLNLVNGKYGVLIDKKKTVPVQVFTPRNSWGFTSTRTYSDPPHALKIRYVDGFGNWSVREELIYFSGYSNSNATEFEEISAFACTNQEQARRYGLYMRDQSILRQENISITTDFENLVCTRGDYVLFQQDAMKAGGTPARVKTVSSNRITIDDTFVDGGGSYGYTFRGVSGISTGTLSIVDSDTADLTGDIPSVGDLLVWGEVGSITINCIVKAIAPSSDLTATLTLVERANAIHDAEQDEDPPTYVPAISTPVTAFDAPAEVEDLAVDENTWECFGGQYQYYVQLDWAAPNDAVETYEVYCNRGSGYALIDYTSETEYKYIVREADLGTEHSFKILAVASTGTKLTLGNVSAVTATPTTKTTPPSDIDGLFINITNETIQLDWPTPEDCDIDYYLVRYSPSLTASWDNSTKLQKVDASTSLTQAQARTGTYTVKAVDWNGNESTNAAVAITSIPELTGLNVIETVNDTPTYTGRKETVEVFGDSLILQEKITGGPGVVEYWDSGEYFFSSILELDDIFTCRVQSSIQAEGYSTDDLMSNWTLLSEVDSLASAATGDWDVETYLRSTDEYITMDTWPTLSSVSILAAGSDDNWSDWKKFTMGDFTGKVFNFKLKLISNKASITPRVLDAEIKVDMPDRIESYNNVTIPNTGYTLTYDPAFAGPSPSPSVQVSIDDAQQGDYFTKTSKTLTGCVISVYDKNGTQVERQADIYVKGYGRKADSI